MKVISLIRIKENFTFYLKTCNCAGMLLYLRKLTYLIRKFIAKVYSFYLFLLLSVISIIIVKIMILSSFISVAIIKLFYICNNVKYT